MNNLDLLIKAGLDVIRVTYCTGPNIGFINIVSYQTRTLTLFSSTRVWFRDYHTPSCVTRIWLSHVYQVQGGLECNIVRLTAIPFWNCSSTA